MFLDTLELIEERTIIRDQLQDAGRDLDHPFDIGEWEVELQREEAITDLLAEVPDSFSGVELIPVNEYADWCRNYVVSSGAVEDSQSWIVDFIDWDGVQACLRDGFCEVEFDGDKYLYDAC